MENQTTPKAKTTTERTKIDAQGRAIPVSVIKSEMLKQDTVVNNTLDRVLRLQKRIISDKIKLYAEIESYLEFVAKKSGLEWKGNAGFTSFDGKYKIEIRFKERIEFGLELQLAKQKIDECIKAWTTDSNVNLRAIINEAFQVDKKGQIAKFRILALRKYNIKDPIWKEAMELIDKAIMVVSTKQYVSFYERDEHGEYKMIVLNFTAL
ncbi:MAG: DUF3164 family protein [Candidatus Cloacimonetes bacterium]|nr:DUF3164 family protein [Candidatus Cloacimonadota bacterium]